MAESSVSVASEDELLLQEAIEEARMQLEIEENADVSADHLMLAYNRLIWTVHTFRMCVSSAVVVVFASR